MHEISGGVSTKLHSLKRKLMASKPICPQVIPVSTENIFCSSNWHEYNIKYLTTCKFIDRNEEKLWVVEYQMTGKIILKYRALFK